MEQTVARFLAVSAAALALSVPAQAQAGSPGSHPAAVVARGSLPYDYTTKFYLHPARLDLLRHAPRPRAEHPAVLVARTWLDRGIDPNHFIPAHPAQSGFAGPGSGLIRPALTRLDSRPPMTRG